MTRDSHREPSHILSATLTGPRRTEELRLPPLASSNRSSDVSHAVIEDLLEYFVSAALGLTLKGRIRDVDDLPDAYRGCCLANPQIAARAWAAWHTDRGPLTASAIYDTEQAQRIGAHVLQITWWLAPFEYHESWWHCYPKRPHEWIKGPGRG
jgi:hypothetical protein